MNFTAAYLVIGSLLIVVAVVASFMRRLPISETMIYLGVGLVLGPIGWGFFEVNAQKNAALLERLSELAVVVSLFTAGLKLRVPLRERRWWIPLRLAFVSMAITVGLIALVGVYGLGLSVGAAILLGGILAPTDPVLASGVQLQDTQDRDRLRFSLTGEAGLNDGTAFPFVMLGLGLLGLHEIGEGGWRWLVVDVLWAIPAGLAIGGLCGMATARLVLWLRREHHEGLGRDEFIALGLIAFSYGAALALHAYGFLAVFAAGLALRMVERSHSGDKTPDEVLAMESVSQPEEIATHPEKAPAHMAGAVLAFNEQMERIMEVALVLVLGAILLPGYLQWKDFWFIAVLFLIIRPIAVTAGMFRMAVSRPERGMLSWLGIRGIGSIYYLMYAVRHGLPHDLAWRLISLTLVTITVSIVLHGITVTPLMSWYSERRRRKQQT